MIKKYYFLIALTFAATLSSCGYDYKEVARVPNPSGNVEAVAIELLTGATVATPTKVYVGGRGSEMKGDPVLIADHMDGLVMAWNGDENLVIKAEKARVFSFTNWVGVRTSEGEKKITIGLDVKKHHE